MPIRIRYKNDPAQECTIRPTPFVSISTNILKNAAGDPFGVNYSITLNGTILADEGSPYTVDNVAAQGNAFGERVDFLATNDPNKKGPYGQFDTDVSHYTTNLADATYPDGDNPNKRPPAQAVHLRDRATAILSKQRVLRGLFAQDGQRLEISDIDGERPVVVCYPRVLDINFDEGQYINTCTYSITLEADMLLYPKGDDDANLTPDIEGLYVVGRANELAIGETITGLTGAPSDKDIFDVYDSNQGITEKKLIEQFNARFIQDYGEDWSLEVDDSQSERYYQAANPNQDVFLPRTYRITHTVNAVGKKHYFDPNIGVDLNSDQYLDSDGNRIAGIEDGSIPAWVQAKKFVQERLHYGNPSGAYPNVFGQIGKGTVSLVNEYRGFNHVITESIDMAGGSYSATETWIMASGNALENWSASISSSTSSPFVSVSIDGSVRGLSEYTPSGYHTQERNDPTSNNYGVRTGFENAQLKYNEISNSGKYGFVSDVYKRADNLVSVELNSSPNSISLSTNEFTGEITYSLQFDNRPTNIISGVLSEDISVNDTYPGDVFAVIPVIGRPTGPILQYIGGRTEYKRDVSISLVVDYTKLPYGKTRNPLLLKKPSIVEPTATQIADLLKELSPANEPGVRKYFINAPTESWNPKNGNYSFSISWTYELDK
jgi:hypothetical protein